MIGFDTNVLVRYIVEDDDKQAKIATRVIDALTSDNPGFVSHLILVELTWVLASCYEVDKLTLISVLEQLLQTKQLIVENTETVWHALEDYKKTSAEFKDCLISRKNQDARCSITLTFDKAASKLPFTQPCT